MDVNLALADLQPQFSIQNPTTECDRNGDYYDSAGKIRGKACPISGAPIRISGPRVTRHTLLDHSPSIKMSDGYCYDKKAFIVYLMAQLRKGVRLDAIKSPMTNVPYGVDELIEFNNAGLINFDNFIESTRELHDFNGKCFYSLIQPGFYYSFDNTFNNKFAQDMYFLYHANQYLLSLGATEPIEYAKKLIIYGYLAMFNTGAQRDYGLLMRFYSAQSLFMPFVAMKKPITYFANRTNRIEYPDDFELNWDNHLFFNHGSRGIFENITKSCWQPSIYSGEMSLRSGKHIEHSKELYPHCNTNSGQSGDWTRLMEYLRMDKHEHEQQRRSRIGGRQRKTQSKSKTQSKTRRSKTRRRYTRLGRRV